MESCIRNKMTQRSIFLAAAILLTCSIAESEGFFLNNLLSETITEELQISTTSTTPSPDTNSTDTIRVPFDESHRNISENLEESSTQIVKSVKDIVNIVLDEHITGNQTQDKLPEENNQIDIDIRNIAVDGNNDIPAPEALVTNIEHDSNDSDLSIVKIPEANNEDIATALEDNIRNSVKDEIQLEQNLESSAIEDIPDPEVRQTLTEDLMAMEYPQSVKKLEENSGESKQSVSNEEDKIDLTKTPIDVTTDAIVSETIWAPNTTVAAIEGISDDVDVAEATTINIFETETVSDVAVTTPTMDVIREITLIPSEEIVHNFEDLQDTSSLLETKPIRTRQMRGFSDESETNEVLSESDDSSEDTKSSKSSKSKSSDSSDSSNSSSSSSSSDSSLKVSSQGKSSTIDENVAAEDTSEEVDEVISQDASIEESLEEEESATALTRKSIPSKKVTPTPRPSIATATEVTLKTTTVESIESDSTDPIMIEGVTESTGEVLNEVASTMGDGKHIVMKKPGVDEELTSTNTTEKPILEKNEAPSDDAMLTNPIELGTIAESNLETRTDEDSVVSHILDSAVGNIEEVPEVIKPRHLSADILNDTHKETKVTENHLLEAEDPHIHLESPDSTQTAKAIDIDPLTASVPLENAPRVLTEIHDNNTEQASVPEFEETVTVEKEDKSTQTSVTEEDESLPITGQDKKENDADPHISSQSPTLQTTLRTLSAEQSTLPETDLLRTLNTDDNKSIDDPTPENTSGTLNVEPAYIPQIALNTDEHKSTLTPSSEPLIPVIEEDLETSTEAPALPLDKAETNQDVDITSEPAFTNEISKHVDETPLIQAPKPSSKDGEEEIQTHHLDTMTYETSTEKPSARSNEDSSPALVKTLIEAAELTTEFTRHVDSFRTTRDETSAISDEIVSPAAAGRTFNAIVAEGLGKPLPTRSVGDEPSTSSYSSEDKTTTVIVLCSSAAVIFIAFSVAIYLITFQRQHGTLDIEMQEQRCGKDDLADEEDAETRVTLLNQFPPVDSDEHGFD